MMDEKVIQTMFALIRSAIKGNPMTDEEKLQFSEEMVPDLMKLAQKHDLAHLVGYGVHKNGLLEKNSTYYTKMQQVQVMAVFRYEKLNYEFEWLCEALEKAEITFIPLKGSVLRRYYPEPWMRTSCDIDVLIHEEDLKQAVNYLVNNRNYSARKRGTHDISVYSQEGIHVELHYDLTEEGYADHAIPMLRNIWNVASLCESGQYRYEMPDEYFYLYHITHMVQHMSTGGCGIRPFVDLWILNHITNANQQQREALLNKGKLLRFATVACKLSQVWIDGEPMDELSLQLQEYIFHGGVYGSSANRVAIHQKQKGGKLGYLFTRIFAPFTKLKRYYPILEKYPWLTPIMQVRRWFKLLRPSISKMAKAEMKANQNIDRSAAKEMKRFLDDIGL